MCWKIFPTSPVTIYPYGKTSPTFYGGFLLATPCCILYARYHRIPILLGMDVVAPLLMIGLGLGRIGCFLNGCCYGEQSNLPWAVRFPYYSDVYLAQMNEGKIAPPPQLLGITPLGTWKLISPGSSEMETYPALQILAAQTKSLPVQPTQLYSTLTAFLLAGLLIAYLTLPHINGRVFALMLMLEGFSRYLLELLRVEPSVLTIHFAGYIWRFSLSMILGLQMAAAGAIMWIVLADRQTKSRSILKLASA
jgi:phosphatidylglycerol:prolipoprotein diacylglycerol transferase